MNLPEGVQSRTIDTDRIRMHYLESGPHDGIPVVLIHGNLSTGRFFEHLLPGAPGQYRFIVPDMRGFGDTERKPIDATRGLRDWADDTHALLSALNIHRPVHIAGWSTGGGAAAMYAQNYPVASVTLIDPVSPHGFGGVRADGTPIWPDHAGSGGGLASPEFVQRLASNDRGEDSPFSPRNVLRTSYWPPTYQMDREREDMLVDEILKSVTGDDGYPGNGTPSPNWPGAAPGDRGILNALSGKYLDWSGILDLDPKPPILWTHGTQDIVIADGSAWDMGTLGRAGHVPGWPGEDAYPPQMMITQIRDTLTRYQNHGGHVEMHMIEGAGHSPFIDAEEQWKQIYFQFLEQAEAGARDTAAD